ncbi:sigma-70 family RNA polymerase sigma factor [Fulvivirgaceae bacterium BMA12]|uniref:Sigma-70 family RNA polymerase sigma factor n=1 Tax=Agaribacillus aureus TaxID=3051825 RepID=A0ABT8L9B6_9BACT|nr:sigma-70 family RNA polymerase sigma factor [Fulvivirgaceae bacterium BMA12]
MKSIDFLYSYSEDHDKTNSSLFSLGGKEEASIWRDFLKGDEASLSYLYRSYANKLYNYGRQFADEDLVQDCIQDLFFDLIKTRNKLSQTQSVKAYLFSSLRRKIVRKLKKNSREVRESKLNEYSQFRTSIVSDNSTPLDQFTENRLHILRKACNTLPPRQREAIMLYYYEQLSYNEIAEVMSIRKVTSVRILVYRALDSLKDLLGGVKDELLIFYLAWLW